MDYRNELEKTTGIPFTDGNKIEILKNGVEIFDAMLSEIRNARQTIDFLTFVYWKGDIAETFANTLAEKAKEGVNVRVLLDSFGALPMPDNLVTHMKDNGVNVVWFRPLTRWKVWKMDNRTHRKILICDNKVGFTGGVGIAKEWEGDARNPDEWRDTHFRIQGPAINGLKSAFIENWIEADHMISDFDKEMDSKPRTDSDVAIQVISTAATVRWSNIMLLYQSLIAQSKQSLRIATAYFNPDLTLIEALKKATARGVKVEILIPGNHTDAISTKIAAEDTFRDLLSAGIDIYYYKKTMMHAKIITVDGIVSCVGSANFNHRSMLKDDEINLVILDKDTTGILNSHFEEDLEHSEIVDHQRWEKRSTLRRAMETVIRPFRQQL